ncbi:MAG: cysteine protease [Gemmatimonadota bacterium]|nr:MAG: cysteine protease [Gemmatimonadota bacterium]
MYYAYQPVEIPELGVEVGTGWLPPLPDLRDYTEDEADIPAMRKALGMPAGGKAMAAPTKVDLREWCSPIEDQGSLGSCTAHAGVGVVEYFETRAFKRHIDASRLFVYKTTRNLMGVVGDTGAWLRNTMGALALCGTPPERYWPYTTRREPGPAGDPTFDDEPPSFVYSVADNYEALRYFCHDPLSKGVSPDKVLASVKRYLAHGIPSMFGFFGFPSFGRSDVSGGIPYPCPGERAIWGHAVVAVGYDDGMTVTNTQCNKKTKGALLIRNSWGTGWGDKGYGWLPYQYLLDGLARDFWSLLRTGWVETKQFGLE